MRTLLFFATGLAALPALNASVILTGIPVFGSFPSTSCPNTSFSPAVTLSPTVNGFSVTGTVTIQISGAAGTACMVSWDAAVPVQLTAGAFTLDGTIDAALTLPANAAPFATFSTRTTLQGFPQLDTTLLLANGQQAKAFNQAMFPAVPAGGSFLMQRFNFTACPCPNGGTVAFQIPVSASISEVPEPSLLILVPSALLAIIRKRRNRCVSLKFMRT